MPCNRVWISSQNAAAVAAKGLRLVHAPSDYFYLVHMIGFVITTTNHGLINLFTTRIAEPVNGSVTILEGKNTSLTSILHVSFNQSRLLNTQRSTRNSWCDPFKTWQKVASTLSLSCYTALIETHNRTTIGIYLQPTRELDACENSLSPRWPAASLGRAIFPRKHGQHRLAARSSFRRSTYTQPVAPPNRVKKSRDLTTICTVPPFIGILDRCEAPRWECDQRRQRSSASA